MTIYAGQGAILKADMLGPSNAALQTWIVGNDWHSIAAWYNASANTTYVWMPDAPRAGVYGAINWKNMTVSETPPSGATSVTDGTLDNYKARCLQCQGFQISLQTMLAPGLTTLPGDQANFRQGLQDALTNVPSGTGGATQNAGWSAVQNALKRYGSRLEVLFSVVDGNANKSSAYNQTFIGNDCYQAYLGNVV